MKRSSLKKLLVTGIILILLMVTAVPAFGAQKVRVFVGFVPGAKENVRNALTQAGAEFHYTFDNLNSFVVSLPQQSINALSKNPNVVDIEEDVPRYLIGSAASGLAAPLADTTGPNGQTIPYGIDAVQARDVWDANRDGTIDSGVAAGAGVTLCIIDSGFYAAHEDLSDVSLIGGESQVDNDFTTDGYGHGSHVAGTIAAVNNGIGVVGVAPNVSLYIVKFFNNDGLATFASDLIAAANSCANHGASIISMSLGGTRASGRERRTFDSLYAQGVLSIAAAGNDGNTAYSYPASYASVVSVAAVDEANVVADFSQQNDQVELSAPGVGVLSTVPFIDDNQLTVGSATYAANHIEFSGRGTAAGTLVDGGLCDSVGSYAGAIVLCERGVISFYDKVMNVQNGGGAAAVIYNNAAGNFLGTLGDGNSSSIIGVSLSQADGQFLVANQLGASASLSSTYTWPASGYEAWDGTSMATPHVSGVAALVWSQNPGASAADIRAALTSTAVDLGAPGRDNVYGYGLVQAAAAMGYFGSSGNMAPSVSISSPADGSSFAAGDLISFSGSANDAEDGNLSASIQWTSSLDGAIGSGASFSTSALSVGTHTITASVTDSGGLSATDSITVTVTGGGTGGGALHVAVATDAPTYGKGDTASITVTVTNDGGAPIAGASVGVSITTPSGKVYSGSATTNASGVATFTFRTNPKKDGSGTYNVDATASLTGYTPGAGSTTFVVQ